MTSKRSVEGTAVGGEVSPPSLPGSGVASDGCGGGDGAGMDLRALVATVADFPRAGIRFRDIAPLLGNGPAFAEAIARLSTAAAGAGPFDAVVAIEARGFFFGAPIAAALGLGFIPARKAGKLPGATLGASYALEYGHDRLELPAGQIRPGQRLLLIDDLIATGGTALAVLAMARGAGADIAAASFLIDLPECGGYERLKSEGVTMLPPLMRFRNDE